MVPDEQSFDVQATTFAMDAAICATAGIRAGDTGKKIDASWIEYALQPIITTVCKEQTGYLDLGSTEESKRWNIEALKNPRLREAFSAVFSMVEILESKQEPTSPSEFESLRQLAKALLV